MSSKMIKEAIGALLALSVATTTQASAVGAEQNEDNNPPDMMEIFKLSKNSEKCYGIAKAGKNDCGNNFHGCAGESKIAGDKNEWIFVPVGLCKKIVGGSSTPIKDA